MESPLINLQKIPLENFIDTLIDLYDRGADYIDILASPNPHQDIMSIIVRVEYINPERNDFNGEEDILPEEIIQEDIELSDDILDKLI